MAKIKSKKMRLGIDPEHPYKEIVIDICYDATDRNTETYRRRVPDVDKRFYIKLPAIMAGPLGITEVYAGDQSTVMVAFEKALEDFKKLNTEVHRVILYSFDLDPDPRYNYKMESPDRYLVGYWAGTYEETVCTSGSGMKRYSYIRIDSEVNLAKECHNPNRGDGKRYESQVPWNEANEKFFIWLKINMAELIRRITDIQKPAALIETINSGRLLPIGNSNVSV